MSTIFLIFLQEPVRPEIPFGLFASLNTFFYLKNLKSTRRSVSAVNIASQSVGKIRSVIIYLADSISLGSLHFLPFTPSDFNHVCSWDIDRLKFLQLQSFLSVLTSTVSSGSELIGDSEMGKNLITSRNMKQQIIDITCHFQFSRNTRSWWIFCTTSNGNWETGNGYQLNNFNVNLHLSGCFEIKYID